MKRSGEALHGGMIWIEISDQGCSMCWFCKRRTKKEEMKEEPEKRKEVEEKDAKK